MFSVALRARKATIVSEDSTKTLADGLVPTPASKPSDFPLTPIERGDLRLMMSFQVSYSQKHHRKHCIITSQASALQDIVQQGTPGTDTQVTFVPLNLTTR